MFLIRDVMNIVMIQETSLVQEQGEEHAYVALARDLKDQGNDLFRSGDAAGAVSLYSQGLALDPDSHALYSNRSAAHLLAGNKSKALYDAEKCVLLAPTWTKGFSRLAAAQQSLGRFDQAIDSLKRGIAIEPDNQSLWTALRSCEEAHASDKKQRFAAAAVERAIEDERSRRRDQDLELAKTRPLTSDPINNNINNNNDKVDEEDLLASFFSEVEGGRSEGDHLPASSADTSSREQTQIQTQGAGTGTGAVKGKLPMCSTHDLPAVVIHLLFSLLSWL
jgi:tetratricopeptide (TPR) repeat protein